MQQRRATERFSSRLSEKKGNESNNPVNSQQDKSKRGSKDTVLSTTETTITANNSKSSSSKSNKFNKIMKKTKTVNKQFTLPSDSIPNEGGQSNVRKRNLSLIEDINKPNEVATKKLKTVENAFFSIIGCRKRKYFAPQKCNSILFEAREENVAFLDAEEWQKINLKCEGSFYESKIMPNTIIVDVSDINMGDEVPEKNLKLQNTPPKGTNIPHTTTINCPPIANFNDNCNSLLNLRDGDNNRSCHQRSTAIKHHLTFKKMSNICLPPNANLLDDKLFLSAKINKTDINITQVKKQELLSSPIKQNANNEESSSQINSLQSSSIVMKVISPNVSTVVVNPVNAVLRKMTPHTSGSIKNCNQNVIAISSSIEQKSANHQELGQIVPTPISCQPQSYINNSNKNIESCKTIKNTTAVCVKPLDNQGTLVTNKTQTIVKNVVRIANNTLATSSVFVRTSATKFSDNSSDSGFDENLLERKSVSPLQDDVENKSEIVQSNVETLYLANGVKVHGEIQNVVLTANESTAKIIQHRKQQQSFVNGAESAKQCQKSLPTSINIAKIPTRFLNKITKDGKALNGGDSPNNIQAIYKNKTIQHENGITTIVPTSSLTANNQMAAMNIAQPNTVTITPAPGCVTTIQSRSLTANSVIRLHPNANSLTPIVAIQRQQHKVNNGGERWLTNTVNNQRSVNPPIIGSTTANPKIILLKSSGNTTIDVVTTPKTNSSLLAVPGASLTITTSSRPKLDKNVSSTTSIVINNNKASRKL